MRNTKHSSRFKTLVVTSIVLPLTLAGGGYATIALAGEGSSSAVTPDDPQHYERYADQNNATVRDSINWLDFGKFKDLNTDQTLRVGSYLEQEITPGYKVKVEVVGLQPFRATDTYKERIDEYGLADQLPASASYDDTAVNTANAEAISPVGIIASPMPARDSNLVSLGFNPPGKVSLAVNYNGPGGRRRANWGVQLKLTGMYGDRTFPVDAVVADSEEANLEYILASTDGSPFELLTEISSKSGANRTTSSYEVLSWEDYKKAPRAISTLRGDSVGDAESMLFSNFTTDPEVASRAIRKKPGVDINGREGWYIDGIGTKLYGPTQDTKKEHRSSPLVVTRDASNLGVYVRTHWNQAAMIGILAADYGDAPESYGEARHLINNNPTQPQIGRVKADVDLERESRGVTSVDWKTDDLDSLAYTNGEGNIGEPTADEGVGQLVPDGGAPLQYDPVTQSMKVLLSPAEGNTAKARAWIDFNENGQFDEAEASNIVSVNSAGLATITFPNAPAPSFTPQHLGARVRIAADEVGVIKPTGTAFSGEVEDFRIPVPGSIPQKSQGSRGIPQSATVPFYGYDEDGRKTAFTPSQEHQATFATVTTADDGTVTVSDLSDTTIDAMKNGKKVGTYTLDPLSGKVTFTPNADFIGTPDPVTVVLRDANDIPAVGSYTPTVTTAAPAESSGKQGQAQSGQPTFTAADPDVPIDENVPATFEDGTTTKTVEGVGTFTVAADGTVTFTPVKSFIGKAPSVVIKRVDTNGTGYFGLYTATVEAVVPTSTSVTTTGVQGKAQSGTPTFTPGDPSVPINEAVAATFDDGTTEKTVDGVGTYTVAADGTVTFTPLKSFTGTATGVTVKRVDQNGTAVTATYTPTVTAVTPRGEAVSTTGVQGKAQSGTPTFTPGDPSVPIDEAVAPTFDDGTTTKTVPGEGTYTVAADGTVTFTPLKSFTGTATGVTVKRVDTNGTAVTAAYTPTVTAVTPRGEAASTTGVQGKAQSGTPTFTPGVDSVPIDQSVPAKFVVDGHVVDDSSIDAKDAQGKTVGTYAIDGASGVVTFTPHKSFVGTPVPVTVQRVDVNGTLARALYTPTVTAVTPTASPAESSGKQGQAQSGTPTFTPGADSAPMDDTVPATFEDGTTTKTVEGVGTFTVAADGTVTFTPVKSFKGKAPSVAVKRVDTNGTGVLGLYTATVEAVVPTSTSVTTTGVQGKAQSGQPTFTPGDPSVPIDEAVAPTFEDGKTTKKVPDEGTYTVAADGTVTFTPVKSFTGTATGVTVKRVDKNGTAVTATYTPTVTAVTPRGEAVSTSGLQGKTQSGTPIFTPGDPSVPIDENVPAKFVVDGHVVDDSSIDAKDAQGKTVGTYTIDGASGVVTFTPHKGFVGTPVPVTVQRVDVNGTSAQALYTPTVTAVTPRGEAVSTTGIQGKAQSGQPTFTPGDPSVPINEAVPATFDDGTTTKKVPDEGTYTVAADGTVTFTPVKSFTGTATGVTVKRVDKNGTAVTATYTPTVTAVIPEGSPAESSGKQGQEQSGKPTFTPGDPDVPMDDTVPATFEDGTTKKTVDGVGTYTVAADGTVTFTPVKSFTGTATGVTVKRVDQNGTAVTGTYTPTVQPVTPTAEDQTSVGKQGLTQSGTPRFTPGDPSVPMDDTVPATFEDGSTTKKVPGEGTYTVAADGTVTFTPEPNFVGGAKTGVTVKRVDQNGTAVTATYKPTVEPVTPRGEAVSTTGVQGQAQSGKPTFTPGDPSVPIDEAVPATFDDGTTTKTVDGVGTFTVATDGTVTFTPVKSFTGTATGVTVKRVDKNGTAVTATYTPTVTAVTPKGEAASTSGEQGQEQSGQPTFTPGDPSVPMDDTVPATFEDGSTTKIVPGEGTYTVTADGTVTFTPEKSFTGTATGVTIKRVDQNGTAVTATYTPTVTAVTPAATPVETSGKQGQKQSGQPTFTPGADSAPIDEAVPATFDDGTTTKTVDGVGTFTVAPDGTVTFTPVKAFRGKAPSVAVKRVDTNGTEVLGLYTATVEPVIPAATPVETSGKQGQKQSGQPTFTPGADSAPIDEAVPATFDDGTTEKMLKGVGIFTVAPDGTVTFTPEKSFSGKAPSVAVKRVDTNGTEVLGLYTATVEAVIPATSPAESSGQQGQAQSGKPTFTPGDPDVLIDETVPATFDDGSTTKKVPGEGTYTVSPDGTVTFTPEPNFVGQASGVLVKRVDVNGTAVIAAYKPYVDASTPSAGQKGHGRVDRGTHSTSTKKGLLASTGASAPVALALALLFMGGLVRFLARGRRRES